MWRVICYFKLPAQYDFTVIYNLLSQDKSFKKLGREIIHMYCDYWLLVFGKFVESCK